MLENINKVAEFQKTTGSPVLLKPTIPDNQRTDLRIGLLQEEVSELENAAYKGNIVDVLDALCDIQYILNGTILEFGLQDCFQEAFNEVHQSNMSKFTVTTQDAQKTVAKYNLKGTEVYYRLVNKLHVIMRTSDNKILKGIHYSEPKLKPIIDKFKKIKHEEANV